MKRSYLILFLLLRTLFCAAQEADSTEEVVTERQMESMADNDETETEDDSYLQGWQELKRKRLNLNAATEHDLQELHLLNDLQIASLLNYRRLIGKLADIYELQAIPGWNIQLIRTVLPFVTVQDTDSFIESLRKRWSGGTKTFLCRTSGVLETAKGFLAPKDSSASHYAGSPLKLFVRYKYNYKGLLQWGILGEKDAGEQFFKGAQKKGFDFYSVHFFARKIGKIKELALGDFTVNMGQGLIQWQSLAYNKGVSVSGIKRQSPVLRPYNSAGEYNFHRGAGMTVQEGKWEITAFLSVRNRDASVTTDSLGNRFVTSLGTSGYHRTRTEIAGKNIQGQTTFGGSLQYGTDRWKIGLNSIQYQFVLPIQKRDDPYNLYAFKGNSLKNHSIDYSYTKKNIHFFGEIAIDNNRHTAMVNGMLVSLGTIADASVLHRSSGPAFQSMYANAFTENTMPGNEKGLYTALTLRPSNTVTIDTYADVFNFPWLKYLVDAPSLGKEYFMQLTYKPDKQVEIYTRYRYKAKQKNDAAEEDVNKEVRLIPQQNWRFHASFKVSNTVTLRTRTEIAWYDRNGPAQEEGFSGFVDVLYKPSGKAWSGNLRVQYFETQGYNSRVYAYENDVLYGATIPALSDKGIRYYINARVNATNMLKHFLHSSLKMDIYLRWAQTVYDGRKMIGSSLDEIKGTKKTDFKCQFMFQL